MHNSDQKVTKAQLTGTSINSNSVANLQNDDQKITRAQLTGTPINAIKSDHLSRGSTYSQNKQAENSDKIVQLLSSLVEKMNTGFGLFNEKINKLGESLAIVNERWTSYLNPNSGFKYIDIDSTYRNRTVFPLSSSFVVPYTNLSPGSNAFYAKDPVSLAYPISSGLTTQSGSTTTSVALSSSDVSIDNYYINNILTINGQNVTITSYNGLSHIATVSPALISVPGSGTAYSIRLELPILIGTLSSGNTQNYIFLSNGSNQSGIYVGQFLYITSGVASGQTKIITEYNGNTKKATLLSALSGVPNAGDTFEIDGFSYDNATPLRYSGSRTINQAVCYMIQILHITIPYQTLNVSIGGTLVQYPYFYVHFYNEPSHSDITMYGNNPASTRATFKIPMSKNQYISSPQWLVFENISTVAEPQIVKFSWTDNIRFRVTLPDGEDLNFSTVTETYSPQTPNPFYQISAMIALKPIPISPIASNI
jgi:hypothetical protein